jgi:hypothetical protein
MPDSVTAAILARWLGISEVAVRDLARRGVAPIETPEDLRKLL